MNELNYYVLAFYYIGQIDDPYLEIKKHKEFFKNRDIRSRIYISEEGINAQMSAYKSDAIAYIDWLKSDERFKDIEIKIHEYDEQVFPKQCVKYRKELVSLGKKIDFSHGGDHISPDQWKQMLEERDENTLLIDVRNDYESEIGHFEGADCPSLQTFRQFPEYVEKIKHSCNPDKTKIMMYCTGGIRCELFSVLFKEAGFHDVYQLSGGVIGYGLKVGSEHWKGKLFVFDDRLAVPISEDSKDSIISHCIYCHCPSDLYHYCANMDCNELFLSCMSCAEAHKGCCCDACMSAPRVREVVFADRPKPFRKLAK